MDAKYQALVRWMVDNEVEFSTSLELKQTENGIAVYAKKTLREDSVILRVPKDQVLSPVTTAIGNLLEDDEKLGCQGMNSLTVAYMYELAQGNASPWAEFIATCTPPTLLPWFWAPEEKQWLQGTEIDRMGNLDESEVIETYETSVAPFIARHKALFEGFAQSFEYEGYKNSLMVVCSRAFQVDNFRGLSLVPGACLFNHNDEENVHFETIGQVCDMCGASDYCDHMAAEELEEAEAQGVKQELDPESEGVLELIDMEDNNSDEEDEEDEKDTCDLRIVKKVKAGQEVFNSYGDHPNSILLSRYGFALWDNHHESINMSREVTVYAKAKNLGNRVSWWSRNFYYYAFGVMPENYDQAAAEAIEADEAPPPTPDEVSWDELAEITSTGVPTTSLQSLVNLLALSPKMFLAAQLRMQRRKPVELGAQKQARAVMTELIRLRLDAYDDGSISSKEYQHMISEVKGQDRKILSLLVRGTEKLVLERAQRNVRA